MAYEGLEYTITEETDEHGNIMVYVDRDNYNDIDENEDAYTYDWRTDDTALGEHIRTMAQRALEKPIWLSHPVTEECYIIHRWGTLLELNKLADGEFVIDIEPE